MAIAFSGAPPVYKDDIDGSTPYSLLTGLHIQLVSAGWQIDEPAEEGDGWKYLLTSEQLLGAKCLVADLGRKSLGVRGLTVQFMSDDEARVGVEHLLLCVPGRLYEVFAGPSQMFVAARGAASTSPEGAGGQLHHAVCGGVPFVPHPIADECMDNPVEEHTVTECWWSSGAPRDIFVTGQCFRWSWNNEFYWDGAYNGGYLGAYIDPKRNASLRLNPTATTHPDYTIYPSNSVVQWLDGGPLYFDPMLIWGYPEGEMRGQVWDAMLGSKDAPLDDEIQTIEGQSRMTWRNWMHFDGDMSMGAVGSYYSSLYLLKGVEGALLPSNYAY